MPLSAAPSLQLSPSAGPAQPVIGGNVFPKYTTKNPIARRLMAGFLAAFDDALGATGARDVHEVGCGEGFLSLRLARAGLRVRGSDLSPAAIAESRAPAAGQGLDLDLTVRDLYHLEPGRDAAELVVCCEVLEHVPDPARALDVLAALARPHLIVSVPREPLWRILNVARGRYLCHLGNTPGHLQHWSQRGFCRFVGRRFQILDTRAPFPWTLLRCRVR